MQAVLKQVERNLNRQRQLFLSTIEKLAGTVELRDKYTSEHSQRVTLFAILLGQQLHISAEDVELILIGTPLHDIGKIGIADAILRKPDQLTQEEFEIMKTHAMKGAEIIQLIPDLRSILPIVRSHHERWGGQGYPDGLKGDDIPFLARIVSVADAFDAMAFDTPYRQSQPVEIAFAEIERQRGGQFDPDVVTAFLHIREKVLEGIYRIENERANCSGVRS
jgi:HD-GYP domain-containing protein (c-di-GMP phosphodiesterase class II)